MQAALSGLSGAVDVEPSPVLFGIVSYLAIYRQLFVVGICGAVRQRE